MRPPREVKLLPIVKVGDLAALTSDQFECGGQSSAFASYVASIQSPLTWRLTEGGRTARGQGVVQEFKEFKTVSTSRSGLPTLYSWMKAKAAIEPRLASISTSFRTLQFEHVYEDFFITWAQPSRSPG
jgi:hypothetical protein